MIDQCYFVFKLFFIYEIYSNVFDTGWQKDETLKILLIFNQFSEMRILRKIIVPIH